MANIYKASCNCGFKRSVRTGGTRETFQTVSYFPFYCKKCGFTVVNIAIPHDLCPDCKSAEIKPYGNPSISLDNKFQSISSYLYSAPKEGNLCPKCGKFSLVFDLQMIAG